MLFKMKLHAHAQHSTAQKHASSNKRESIALSPTPAHAANSRALQQRSASTSRCFRFNVHQLHSDREDVGSPVPLHHCRSTVVCKATAAARHAPNQATQTYQSASHMLPEEPLASVLVQEFKQAAAAAEARQAQLLGNSTSAFGQLLGSTTRLAGLAQLYSLIQTQHHKAVQQKLQQYGSISATLPGFAYAVLSEAAGQPMTRVPGDQVQLADLFRIFKKISGPTIPEKIPKVPQPLVQLAKDLVYTVSSGGFSSEGLGKADDVQPPAAVLLDDLKLLVLPDILTLLLDSLSPAAAERAGQLPSTARWKQVEWTAPPEGASSLLAHAGATATASGSKETRNDGQGPPLITEQLVTQLLQQPHQRGSTVTSPVRLHQIEALAQQLNIRDASNAQFVSSIACNSVRLLTPEDQQVLNEYAADMALWSSSAPGLYQVHSLTADPAALPALLVSLLHVQLFAAVCYSTVSEQMEGKRAITPAAAGKPGFVDIPEADLTASWGPVGMVAFKMCSPWLLSQHAYHRHWVETQATAYQLLHWRADEGLKSTLNEHKGWPYIAKCLPFLIVDARLRLADALVRREAMSNIKGALLDAVVSVACVKTQGGPLLYKVLDTQRAGWYSLAYWADLAQLTQQQPGGDTSVAALSRLMSEKHSIFFERQFQRMALLQCMSDSELAALRGSYTITTPLSNFAAQRNWLIARGDLKTWASLQAQYPAVPDEIAKLAQLSVSDPEQPSTGPHTVADSLKRLTQTCLTSLARRTPGTAAEEWIHGDRKNGGLLQVTNLPGGIGVMLDIDMSTMIAGDGLSKAASAVQQALELVTESDKPGRLNKQLAAATLLAPNNGSVSIDKSYYVDRLTRMLELPLSAEDDKHDACLIKVLWMMAAGADKYAESIMHIYAAWLLGTEPNTSGAFWYQYAVSQLYIRSVASSSNMAQLMLGPGAIEEQWLRPIAEVEERLSTSASLIMEQLVANTRVNSRTAKWIFAIGKSGLFSALQPEPVSTRYICGLLPLISTCPIHKELALQPLQLSGGVVDDLPEELKVFAPQMTGALALRVAGDQLLAGGAKPLLQKAVQSWLQQSAQETHSHAQTGGILLNALSVLLSRIKRQSFFNSPELLQLLEHLPWPSGFLQPAIMLTALLDRSVEALAKFWQLGLQKLQQEVSNKQQSSSISYTSVISRQISSPGSHAAEDETGPLSSGLRWLSQARNIVDAAVILQTGRQVTRKGADAAVQEMGDVLLNSSEQLHTRVEQGQELFNLFLRPALELAAALADSSGEQQRLVARKALEAAHDMLAHLVRLGQHDASAETLEQLLQLQMQLDPQLQHTPPGSRGAMTLYSNVSWVGGLVGLSQDDAALERLLQWMRPCRHGQQGQCLPTSLAAMALGSALQVSLGLDGCEEAIRHMADRYNSLSGQQIAAADVDSRVQFAAKVLQLTARIAAEATDTGIPLMYQRYPVPDLMPHLLGSDALEALCRFVNQEQLQSNRHLAQLFPSKQYLQQDLLADLLQIALVEDAPVLAQHLLQGAPDAQLQKLPADMLVTLCVLVCEQMLDASGEGDQFNHGQHLLQLLTAVMQHPDAAKLKQEYKQALAENAIEAVTSSNGDMFQQLSEWLQQYIKPESQHQVTTLAAEADFVHAIIAECWVFPAKQTWQLYQQLVALQDLAQSPDSTVVGSSAQTTLSAAAADVLIQQQREPSWYGTSADKVLQLLQHALGRNMSLAALLPQLSEGSQQAVLAACVRLGQHTQALELAQQGDLMMDVLQLWRKQQQQQLASGTAVESSSSLDEGDSGARRRSNSISISSGSRQGQERQRQPEQLRVRGPVVSLKQLRQAFQAGLRMKAADITTQVLQLMKAAAEAAGLGVAAMLTQQQLEEHLQLLCQKVVASSNKQQAMVEVQQLVAASLAGHDPEPFSTDAVAAYATAAAAVDSGPGALQEQQLLDMAATPVLVQAALQLARERQAAALCLLLQALLDSSRGQEAETHTGELVDVLSQQDGSMQQLLAGLCSTAEGFGVAEQLLQVLSGHHKQPPAAAALLYLEAASQQQHLQPAAAAVHLGLVDPQQLAAVAASSSEGHHHDHQSTLKIQPDLETAAKCRVSTRLLAQISINLSQEAAGQQVDITWVDKLSSTAAATALFSCWLWQVPHSMAADAACAASCDVGDAELLLSLYHRSRQAPGAAKPSLDSCVLDLGLAAAGRAAAWQEGAAILSSARTILSGGKGASSSSSRASSQQHYEWIPLLPESRAVLLAVLVHQHHDQPHLGVQQAGQLLLDAANHARQQQLQAATGQQQAERQHRNKGRWSGSSSLDSGAEAAVALLTGHCLKAYLAAVVDVLQQLSEWDREQAATAAADMAAKLLVQLLGGQAPTAMGAATSSGIAAVPALLLPDAATYGLFVQLFGAAGRYDRVAQLTSQAIRQHLPLARSSSDSSRRDTANPWSPADLQCVLSSAACVWLSAGRRGLALVMLDGLLAAGVSMLDNPVLAAAVLEAVDQDGELDEGLERRLADPADMFEALPALAEQCLSPLPFGIEGGSSQGQHQSEEAIVSGAWQHVMQGMMMKLTADSTKQQEAATQGKHSVQLKLVDDTPPEQLLQQLELSMQKAAKGLMA